MKTFFYKVLNKHQIGLHRRIFPSALRRGRSNAAQDDPPRETNLKYKKF